MTAPGRSRKHDADERDAIARNAAQRLSRGLASDVADATKQAMAERGSDSNRRGMIPSAMRIRQHAQAIEMQALGEQGYRDQIRAWLELAEDLMTTIEQAIPDSETLLVGRAADAHFDGDPAIHIRVRCDVDIGSIARAIAMFGYDESEATFPTMDCHYGRFSQMQWIDEGGVRVTLTRCPLRSVFEDHLDLVKGKPIASINVQELRLRLRD